MFDHGRLGGTGYLSILPVDQGIEHSAGASFAKNPDYFDPERIVELAIEGGCNAVATTFGVLGAMSRKYAHRIPFIVKMNHNELLTLPNKFDQIMFGSVEQAYDLGDDVLLTCMACGNNELEVLAARIRFCERHQVATGYWYELRCPECGELHYKDDHQFCCPA